MRYAASLTFALTLGLGLAACQVTLGKGANDPNAAATTDPNAAATAATAPAATGAATTPAATSTPVKATRIRPGATTPEPAPTNTGGGTASAGNLPAPVVTGSNDFGSGTASPDSLLGQVYFIPEGTSKFPDVSTIRPTAVLYAKQFDIAPRSFEAGFPGVDKRFEWFAVRYTGQFTVATAGAYKFKVLSDDGCNIYVDGAKVLDNDGIHPPQNHVETVQLTAGPHTIQLDYFQGPKFNIALQFWVTPPGGTERLFTTAL